ncbi:MAG: PIN domain-containing protein [Pontiellaceae bacterium]|jgi:predicted nucleic acid-binding protein|nr:PIN domain-containing protein [Pontiellaceae bacterium]
MRVYLDNCCFNRPFDDQVLLSVRLETEAKLFVQELVAAGTLALGWSYILDLENAANPCEERRTEIQRWEKLADRFAVETPEVLQCMHKGVAESLKPLDALHVACAKATECEVFLTVDKGILRKSGIFPDIRIMSPVEFVMKWEAKHAG